MFNNNNMMGNMMPNDQNFNNFNNNGNNFNNNNFMMNNGMNMHYIPNMNVNLQGMVLNEAQNWQEIYQNQNIQQLQNNGDRKVNVVLSTTMGIKVNMRVNFGKRVCDLIELYFKLINREDLYRQPQDLCFICNAKKIDFKDQTPVELFFRSGFANITINDVRGLIGA